MDEMLIGAKVRVLRQRGGVSLRELARRADIAVSYLSSLEKDKVSPTLATLRKILVALGTNFVDFFGESSGEDSRYVFRHSAMKQVRDQDRDYNLVFPNRRDIQIEVMDENYRSAKKLPAYETMEGAFAGYVISGKLTLEVDNAPPVELLAGDAFHIPAGVPLRGYCGNGQKARLITILCKPAEEDEE